MCSAAGRAPNDHRNAIDQSYFPVHSALPTALLPQLRKYGAQSASAIWDHGRAAPYTAMGDAVNVASRLEGRIKASGVGSW